MEGCAAVNKMLFFNHMFTYGWMCSIISDCSCGNKSWRQ